PSVRKDRAFERLISLQAYDYLVIAIDVARLVRQHCRGSFCVDREHALFPLFLEIGLQLGPYRFCFGGRRGQKFLAAGIGRDVTNDKIAGADWGLPVAGLEAPPWVLVALCLSCFFEGAAFHGDSPCLALIRCPFLHRRRAVSECIDLDQLWLAGP